MSSILFKRLFEVQVLHDYYLTATDGTSFYEKNKSEKHDTLVKKLSGNVYDVRDLFVVQPTASTNRKLGEYKLKMAMTAMGFIVGAEVTVEKQAGETVYKPIRVFGEDLVLSFSIRPSISFFGSMTNLSLRPPLPARYYFTNKDKDEFDEGMIPNYTSLPLSKIPFSHQAGMLHEMGAIVDFAGTIREAIQETDGTNASHWETISDKRVVTNADLVLLPHKFSVPIKKEAAITQANFVLEDTAAAVIKTIARSGATVLEDVLLDFTRVDDTDVTSDVIPDGHYTLKVKLGGGPEIAYPVYLNDPLYNKDYLGAIEIRADELNSPFSLLDAGGFLKTRINALNEKIPHPVFEVRFKNRKTYWRYNQENDFSAAEVAATAAHLQHQPPKLVSIKPKPLTATLVPFVNGVSLMLPHPKVPSVKVQGDKIFSEIYINQSNRLLNS